jgi:alpha-beta hydrolase superfamily lysophospholipase
MAFEVALNGGPRIPIVPLGLSYSTPSGNEFRGSVLVDVGRPIVLSDELIKEYEEGDRGVRYELCKNVTDKIERRLRDCTIRVPDWVLQLETLCTDQSLPRPKYEDVTNIRDESKHVVLHVGDRSFQSASVLAKAASSDGEQRRAVAKEAFFSLSGASTSTGLATVVDRDFVEHMHLARRIYKPHNVHLNLAQYASLTRNFMKVALKNANDTEFQHIWRDLSDYKGKLEAMKITDKYVSSHAKGSDPLNERLNNLRTGARKDVAKLALFGPLSLLGTVSHLPIIALAWQAGQVLGVEKNTGDVSVVATMRLLAAFVGCCVAYPTAAVGAGYMYGVTAAVATIPFMTLSAYAAINYPVYSAISAAQGSFTLLTKTDAVDNLRDKRTALQSRIRAWSDAHATEPEMVGWWKDPASSVEKIRNKQKEFEKHLLERDRIVKMSSFEEAEMSALSISLNDEHKRQSNERAVVTFKQDDENHNALIWIPGRNDSFFHVHVLQRFLDAGFDVYALDLRRCGRAKLGDDGLPAVDPMLAHDSYDFREYYTEIDALIKFVKNPNPLPGEGKVLQSGGCGKVYDNVVMYAHSTGALVAGMYATDGAWRGALDGFIFNSPFWSWNLSRFQKIGVKNLYRTGVTEDTLIDKGGELSEYSANMRKHYHFDDLLKSETVLATSVGWCKAVTLAQEQLKEGKMVLGKPALVLCTPSDEVLDAGDIDKYSDYLVKERTDGKRNSTQDVGALLVERIIESTVTEKSGHDVLAADSAVKVDEAMGHIEKFLIGRFGFRPV